MKKITLAFLFIVSCFTLIAQGTWKADPNHSKLGFTITHMGIADVPGRFDKFEVKATTTEKDFSDAVVEMTAETNTINTRVAPRDKHLKSADFFDAEKFPAMVFKSASVKKSGENKYKLTGDLTMHGITKSVTMDMWYRGTIENENKKLTAGIQITGTIKRSDFDIGPKFPAPMLSDEVVIKADGEFGQQVEVQ